ncbi:MAG: rhodanese-like domain-containing protein [Deltaproteobacteria bacterium]|nr:MAG: rhodanese-like domain-containing protein [Deltaproteobacteria bacterium]
MVVKQISVQEAHDILQKEPACIYIDVRTVREFVAGHPKGGVNIPVAFPDPGRGMVMNEEFVKVVEGHFARDKKIIVGCQAGPRADAAARLLQEAGYQDVSSMQGGFGGMRDPFGQVIAQGWASLGFPVSQENGEGVSYESLAAKVK